MLIKLSKKLIESIDDGKLKRFGIDLDRMRYGANSLSITIDDMDRKLVKELQSIVSKSKVFGAKSCAKDIQYWLDSKEEVEKTGDASGFADMKVRKVEFFAQYLREYFAGKKQHRVYVRDDERGVTFCSYIYDIDYTPAVRHHDYTTPEHVTFDLAWMEFGEEKSQTYTFYADDCSHFRVVRESLRLKNIYFADEALDKQYEDSIKRFNEIGWNIGEQYLATGMGTDDIDDNDSRSSYWWRSSKIILDKDEEPANVVIDVFRETDKEENRRGRNTIEKSWWHVMEERDDVEENIVEELPIHPNLVIFALKKQMRLRVHVDQLEKYEYDHSLGDKLILPDESTRLVNTLLRYDGSFQDIVKNKGGGAIVLCTGIAGTGKTLTAEVYAEVMEKPLYTIQCSQLGIDPEELEKELLTIFSRSERWGAILLLDEADVYIRERGNDLQQNAIVGVFLRVLEYYRGVMFMTTNREKDIDDAIASRCIARINYTIPESEEKMADLWRVQAEVQGFTVSEATIKKLAATFNKLTGRDIKNLLKLAKLLEGDEKPLNIKTIEFARQFKPTRGIYD